MLYFLQPIWLWASAAIIVPITIHLWNVTKGKTLKVGSLIFITENANTGAKHIKLSQLLLLLLRCLLIIALAMFIAKPVWKKPVNKNEKGWILIQPTQVQQAYKAYQPLIDSLTKQGYVLHHFDESFEEEDLQKALIKKTDTSLVSDVSYWTLLKELDQKLQSHLPIVLFTNNELKRFESKRPNLSLQIKWYTYSSVDTASSWLQKAWMISKDSVRLIIGNSQPSETHYSYQNLSLNEVDKRYKIVNKHQKLFIQSNDSSKQIIPVDTSSLIITVYANVFTEDANYVSAAIQALKDFTQYNIVINVINDIKKLPPKSDWLFWLSEDTIPATLLKQNVLSYAKGNIGNEQSVLCTKDENYLSGVSNISLYKRINNGTISNSYQTVWKDGFDKPVLSLQKGQANSYLFCSRFNPQWNDLVWSDQFPQVLYNLIFAKDNVDPSRDKRIIDTSQIRPIFLPNTGFIDNKKQVNENNLSILFWSICFTLLAIERLLSLYYKKEKK